MLSVDRRSVSSKGIAEFTVRLGANGSSNAVDINVGLANGTSTTDADAVTEHVFSTSTAGGRHPGAVEGWDDDCHGDGHDD